MIRKCYMIALMLALLLLSGCALRTLDDLYQVPKHADTFDTLQSAIDKSMAGLEYCAPLNGENLQTVQTVDLDGDGVLEYLLYARGTEEMPLHILIFVLKDGQYVLSDTIQSHGTAFDMVMYSQMDDHPGMEIIVGCQISQDVARSVGVYGLRDGKAWPLLSTNYTSFVSCDLVDGERSELMVLRPGETDEDCGVAELYTFSDQTLVLYDHIELSGAAESLKHVESVELPDGVKSLHVYTAVGGGSVAVDILAVVNGKLTNLAASEQ